MTAETLVDLIEAAIDAVHDMDVTHRDYANAAADAVISEYPELQGWMGINTAPKTQPNSMCGPVILLASTSGHKAVGYWGKGRGIGEGWICLRDHLRFDYGDSFTHWREFPELGLSTPHDVTKTARGVTSPDQIGE
jgi:hypothetical protein